MLIDLSPTHKTNESHRRPARGFRTITVLRLFLPLSPLPLLNLRAAVACCDSHVFKRSNTAGLTNTFLLGSVKTQSIFSLHFCCIVQIPCKIQDARDTPMRHWADRGAATTNKASIEKALRKNQQFQPLQAFLIKFWIRSEALR